MIVTAYLLQSVLIIAWWVAISLSDSFYKVFEYPGMEPKVFSAFFIPDIATIALLSLYLGYKSSRSVQLIILGAFLYAALFCVNASLLSGGGYFPTTVMLIGLSYNVFLCFGSRMFRTATSPGLVENTLKTIVQVICIWFLTLVVIPFLMLKAFGDPVMPDPGSQVWIGLIILLLFSLLGLWSAYAIVTIGRGTPLPLDQTNELVTVGPYHYVRNPMAVAGIGQGFSIGIIYMSVPIFFYAILGAVIWHYAVRPIEERDMLERFGEDYHQYQSQVRCWLPRLNNGAV